MTILGVVTVAPEHPPSKVRERVRDVVTGHEGGIATEPKQEPGRHGRVRGGEVDRAGPVALIDDGHRVVVGHPGSPRAQVDPGSDVLWTRRIADRRGRRLRRWPESFPGVDHGSDSIDPEYSFRAGEPTVTGYVPVAQSREHAPWFDAAHRGPPRRHRGVGDLDDMATASGRTQCPERVGLGSEVDIDCPLVRDECPPQLLDGG